MKVLDDTIDWFKKRMSDSAFMLGILLVIGAVAGANGRQVIVGVVKEEVAPIERHDAEQDQKLEHQADDFHELGKDMRALYLYQTTKERQERLERPFPSHFDGGTP